MSFDKIICPKTKQEFSIHTKEGKRVLKNYIRYYKAGGDIVKDVSKAATTVAKKGVELGKDAVDVAMKGTKEVVRVADAAAEGVVNVAKQGVGAAKGLIETVGETLKNMVGGKDEQTGSGPIIDAAKTAIKDGKKIAKTGVETVSEGAKDIAGDVIDAGAKF